MYNNEGFIQEVLLGGTINHMKHVALLGQVRREGIPLFP